MSVSDSRYLVTKDLEKTKAQSSLNIDRRRGKEKPGRRRIAWIDKVRLWTTGGCVLHGRWRGHGLTGGRQRPPVVIADMKNTHSLNYSLFQMILHTNTLRVSKSV